MVYRHGGAIDFSETTELSEQPLLAGLTDGGADRSRLARARIRTYQAARRSSRPAIPPTSLFFLRSGAVHVTLPDGIRLATLDGRNAVRRDGAAGAAPLRRRTRRHGGDRLRNPLRAFRAHSASSTRTPASAIMRNLAQLLADRLIVANAKVDLLSVELSAAHGPHGSRRTAFAVPPHHEGQMPYTRPSATPFDLILERE